MPEPQEQSFVLLSLERIAYKFPLSWWEIIINNSSIILSQTQGQGCTAPGVGRLNTALSRSTACYLFAVQGRVHGKGPWGLNKTGKVVSGLIQIHGSGRYIWHRAWRWPPLAESEEWRGQGQVNGWGMGQTLPRPGSYRSTFYNSSLLAYGELTGIPGMLSISACRSLPTTCAPHSAETHITNFYWRHWWKAKTLRNHIFPSWNLQYMGNPRESSCLSTATMTLLALSIVWP